MSAISDLAAKASGQQGSDTGGSAISALAARANPPSLGWGDVGRQAIAHFVPSAMEFGANMVQPILHPIKTGEALVRSASGEVEKMGDVAGYVPGASIVKSANEELDPKNENEKYANALNEYFADRYGSLDGFKRALASDPVGVAGDISLLFAPGEAAARLPSVAGKIGKIAATVSRVTNPVSAVAKGARLAAPLAADIVGYLGTHTGSQALKLAAQAGAMGGQAAQTFLNHMRGNASIEEIVNSAKTAVRQMREERGTAYRAGMQQVSNDRTVLDFNDIDQHIAKSAGVKKFHGQDLAPETKDIRQQISDVVDAWKNLQPDVFHTPEGFDALKQRISSLRDSLPYGSPERLIADNAYHAVRQAIVDQAPVYGKVMKDYEDASRELDEMQKTLSLNPKASVDTAARKLLSIMRNNVNTNFGRRADLGKVLAKHGAPDLPFQLAGETMSPHFPVGVGRLEAGLPGLLAWMAHDPSILLAYPFLSPRIMGESAYYLGKAAAHPASGAIPAAAVASYGASHVLNPHQRQGVASALPQQ